MPSKDGCVNGFRGCLSDPKKIVKYGVLSVCMIVVVFQVSKSCEIYMKLKIRIKVFGFLVAQ